MIKYFDRTFLKFFVGFVSVIVMSVSAMFITNYFVYQPIEQDLEYMQSSIEFVGEVDQSCEFC